MNHLDKILSALRMVNDEPSEIKVHDACLSFRHDYGLMSEEDRKKLQFEAKEWLRAWQKAFQS